MQGFFPKPQLRYVSQLDRLSTVPSRWPRRWFMLR
jgi:hypothetical protein